eukprot:845545-Amorphochlora_amoeboformis.AAC.1
MSQLNMQFIDDVLNENYIPGSAGSNDHNIMLQVAVSRRLHGPTSLIPGIHRAVSPEMAAR